MFLFGILKSTVGSWHNFKYNGRNNYSNKSGLAMVRANAIKIMFTVLIDFAGTTKIYIQYGIAKLKCYTVQVCTNLQKYMHWRNIIFWISVLLGKVKGISGKFSFYSFISAICWFYLVGKCVDSIGVIYYLIPLW